MDQGKVAHYRNQNVYFDVDFIANRNVSLGTGSAKKGWKFYLQKDLRMCRKTLRCAIAYGLTLSDKKRVNHSHRDDEKDDFRKH